MYEKRPSDARKDPEEFGATDIWLGVVVACAIGMYVCYALATVINVGIYLLGCEK